MKTVNILGAGLIGQERMKAVARLEARGLPVRIGAVYDPFQPRLQECAVKYGFHPEADLERFCSQPADLIVIACPHDSAVEYTCSIATHGRSVLLEKPLGRNLAEAEEIAAAFAASGGKLFVGLNYRFMRGIVALIGDFRAGVFGTPISLRLQMGHGGRPGDEQTWKLDPVRCGGGAVLDPGIHLFDLVTLMLGDNLRLEGRHAWRGFWKTGIEEDVHLLFRAGSTAVSMEVSVVRWRSQFEIFALGTDGYGHVTGRGRSYGPQVYRRGKRWGWQTAASQLASEEEVVVDDCEDSFAEELAACLGFDPTPAVSPAQLRDGLAVMRVYEMVQAELKGLQDPNQSPF
jgi:predicted dehydrogenase